MKSLTAKPHKLQILAVSLLGIGVMAFLFFPTQATNGKEHAQIQTLLRQTNQIDVDLAQEVLSLRFRLVGSCDAIVEKSSQLESVQAELERTLYRGYPQRPDDIVECLSVYKKTIAQKQELIENFKSTRAILNNSLIYYPLANTRLVNELNASKGQSKLIVEINRLDHNILLYNLTKDDSLKSQSETQIATLCQVYPLCPPQAQDDFAILLKHAHSILKHKREVDTLLAKIVKVPTDEANNALYAVEQSHFQAILRYSSRCRYAVYFICLLLIGYVVCILKNLNEQKKALRFANDNLEHRVAQRTQALHESQERYEVAVAGSNEGIWDRNIETGGVYFSPRLKEMLGYTEAEFENNAKAFFERIHPDDRAQVKADSEAHLCGETPYLSHDFRLRHKNGEYRWFHARGKALRDAQGQPYRMAGSITDITDRKLLETQLVHAQKMESIGQLAAGVAHEINTPIQYIGDNLRFLQEGCQALQTLHQTYTDLIATAQEKAAPQTSESEEKDGLTVANTEATTDVPRTVACVLAALAAQVQTAADEADLAYLAEEMPCAFTQSLEGVERVANIVRAMKEFSHPGAKDKTPTDLNHALESTLTVARNEWKYAADLVMDFAPDLPRVPCLPGDVNQVFLNLIVNAAHAIGDVVGGSGNKGVITVSTRQAGEWVEVRITDSGTGIPEGARSRLFDPFFTTKEVGKGTGQGLAIAHAIIVEKHGGTIHFETHMGKGTTFIVRLPLHANDASGQSSDPQASGEQTSSELDSLSLNSLEPDRIEPDYSESGAIIGQEAA